MSEALWGLMGVGVVIIIGLVASRILAARRLSKHLDMMQATEAAKAVGRKQDRASPGA